jgi:CRP-like cAMP-binding protein
VAWFAHAPAEPPSISFGAGDVVGEKQLAGLGWGHEPLAAGAAEGASPTADSVFTYLPSTDGGPPEQCMLTSADTQYLQLAEADRALMPPRMAWIAENLVRYKVLRMMEAFRALSANQIEELLRNATTIRAEPEERISSATSAANGQPNGAAERAGHLSIIVSGRVRVSRRDSAGRVDVLGRLSVGQHFGAKNLVDPSARREVRKRPRPCVADWRGFAVRASRAAAARNACCTPVAPSPREVGTRPSQVDVDAETKLELLALDAAAFGSLLPLVEHALARELANRRWTLENRGKVAMADLYPERTIGIGTFGRVRLAIHAPSQRPYALKLMKKKHLVRANQVVNVRSENKLLSTCMHPFLLKLAGAFQDAHTLYMVLEFIQGGELYRLLASNPEGLEVSHARCAPPRTHLAHVALRAGCSGSSCETGIVLL